VAEQELTKDLTVVLEETAAVALDKIVLLELLALMDLEVAEAVEPTLMQEVLLLVETEEMVLLF
jgi:hypothetical protein